MSRDYEADHFLNTIYSGLEQDILANGGRPSLGGRSFQCLIYVPDLQQPPEQSFHRSSQILFQLLVYLKQWLLESSEPFKWRLG